MRLYCITFLLLCYFGVFGCNTSLELNNLLSYCYFDDNKKILHYDNSTSDKNAKPSSRRYKMYKLNRIITIVATDE